MNYTRKQNAIDQVGDTYEMYDPQHSKSTFGMP